MKKQLVLFIITYGLLCMQATAQTKPEWQDETVTSVGKEYPRTSFMTFESAEKARNNDFSQSAYFQSLNGKWKFNWVNAYKNRPADFYKPEFDDRAWGEIDVPANWEINGYGTPVYINHGYDFCPKNPQPPALPEENPVGSYRKTFELPATWTGREVYLHIGAVKSGCYAYINGEKIGYSEDSKNPVEYNITRYLKPGKNVLALEVYKWSTGSYLECQDFWRISGIERDVYLFSQPKAHIQDFTVKQELDNTYKNGLFGLEVIVENKESQPATVTVVYELKDKTGKIVAQNKKKAQVKADAREKVSFDATINNVAAWTAETPNLYHLTISLEQNGRTTEYIPFSTGFRKLEIRGNQFLVNGKVIHIKGVNIHEHNQHTGHVVSEANMRQDFETMKRNNFNAVRCCHYPQQRRFYELCNEYGLYVCDEANIESHGMYYDLKKGGTLGNNPAWLNAHMDRTRNMYERNKNYPCITFWSLGNEAGNGYNFYMTYNWLKGKEPMRPVQYERALLEWNTDIFCPQYPGADLLRKWGNSKTDRPYIASEYAHAMGNSTGDLMDQWEVIYRYPNLQGGFIWEWIDHGLLIKDKEGKELWAYGGDFGKNAPSDGNFVCTGIINPNRIPHPGMTEVKKAYQYIWFLPVDLKNGAIKIENRYDFTNLEKYRIEYKIYANGSLLGSGMLPVNLAPGESKEITIPVKNLKEKEGVEYFVNFYATSKEATPGIPAGHTVATEQFKLPVETPRKVYTERSGQLKVNEEAGEIKISGTDMDFVFNVNTGTVTSYKINGIEYLANSFGFRPNFWRGPTDNDYGNRMPSRMQAWKQAGEKFKIAEKKIETGKNNITLSLTYALGEVEAKYNVIYTIYPSGIIHVKGRLGDFKNTNTQIAELPRIGMRFRLPATMDNLEYFGRGPEENYCDRKSGTLIGRYKSTAEAQYYPYVRPQENGHKTDVRWLALTEKSGKGVLIVADPHHMEFNAMRNPIEDFDSEESNHDYQWNNFTKNENHDPARAKNIKPKQTHINDIIPRDYVEVCIDHRMMGLAGDDSWGAEPYPQYKLFTKNEYVWSFTLVPIENSADINRKSSLTYQ